MEQLRREADQAQLAWASGLSSLTNDGSPNSGEASNFPFGLGFLLATFCAVFGTLFGHKNVALLNPKPMGKLQGEAFFFQILCWFCSSKAAALSPFLKVLGGEELGPQSASQFAIFL